MKITQRQRVINYIRKFGSITSKEAYNDLGITKLAKRIKELKEQGYEFKTEWERGENRYKEPVSFKKYYLADMVAENMNYTSQI